MFGDVNGLVETIQAMHRDMWFGMIMIVVAIVLTRRK